MMPAALAPSNAVTPGQGVVWLSGTGPMNPIYTDPIGGSNVVEVDFAARGRRPASNGEPVQHAEWLEVAHGRLAAVCRLEDGWDGLGSISPDANALARAGHLLERAFQGVRHPAPPQVVPCGDGSIQLEWCLTDSRFELTIEADGSIAAWALVRDTKQEFERDGDQATELLLRWAQRLTADKLLRRA